MNMAAMNGYNLYMLHSYNHFYSFFILFYCVAIMLCFLFYTITPWHVSHNISMTSYWHNNTSIGYSMCNKRNIILIMLLLLLCSFYCMYELIILMNLVSVKVWSHFIHSRSTIWFKNPSLLCIIWDKGCNLFICILVRVMQNALWLWRCTYLIFLWMKMTDSIKKIDFQHL